MSSWIDDYLNYCEGGMAPRIYSKWGAIAVVAACMRHNYQLDLFPKKATLPNLYIFLLGGSGSGKSMAIDEIEMILRRTTYEQLISTEGSINGFLKALENKSMYIGNEKYNPGFFVSSEFGTFLSDYDPDAVSALARLYDNGPYDQNFKDEKLIVKLNNCTFSILGGIQPRVAFRAFPQPAWEQGFCQRILWVHSDTRKDVRVFPKDTMGYSELPYLTIKLQKILEKPPTIVDSKLGIIDVLMTPEARALMIAAYDDRFIGCPKGYVFPREVDGYVERRFLFIWKLSMVFAAARYDDETPTIRLEDVDNAIGSLVELESNYNKIYSNIKVSNSDVFEKAKALVYDSGESGISLTSLMNKLCSTADSVSAAMFVIKALQSMPEVFTFISNQETQTQMFYSRANLNKKRRALSKPSSDTTPVEATSVGSELQTTDNNNLLTNNEEDFVT